MSGRINGSYTLKLKVYPEGAGSPPAASFPEAAGSPPAASFPEAAGSPAISSSRQPTQDVNPTSSKKKKGNQLTQPPRNLSEITDKPESYYLNNLNVKDLTSMMTVSKHYKSAINNLHLDNKVQREKCLILAKKKVADKIQDPLERTKYYFDIATQQAKLNPESAIKTFKLAKQTLDDFFSTSETQESQNYLLTALRSMGVGYDSIVLFKNAQEPKQQLYFLIALRDMGLNPESAFKTSLNLSFKEIINYLISRLQKNSNPETTKEILDLARESSGQMDPQFKSLVFRTIATELANLNHDLAKQTFDLAKEAADHIQDLTDKVDAYCAIASAQETFDLKTAKETITKAQPATMNFKCPAEAFNVSLSIACQQVSLDPNDKNIKHLSKILRGASLLQYRIPPYLKPISYRVNYIINRKIASEQPKSLGASDEKSRLARRIQAAAEIKYPTMQISEYCDIAEEYFSLCQCLGL